MSKEPHIHNFDQPTTVKVPLRKYETIEGNVTTETVGYDLVKVRKCKCGKVMAYNLERHKQ